jgi:hypothetical protein
VHTPLFCGQPSSAGTLFFLASLFLDLLTSWLIVGMRFKISY